MKTKTLWTNISAGLIALSFATASDAALVSRLGGLAYYDTVADLTWLADANAAQTSGYDTDGHMTWQVANDWAAGLTVGGVSGWRLADTLASCDTQSSGGGSNCIGSELGDLFYNALGNTAGSLTSTGPFSNIKSFVYWSATEYAPNTINAWRFNMSNGFQTNSNKNDSFIGWAVQSGDVSAVPVPAAAWLFGSGLLGLVGVARRKNANL